MSTNSQGKEMEIGKVLCVILIKLYINYMYNQNSSKSKRDDKQAVAPKPGAVVAVVIIRK